MIDKKVIRRFYRNVEERGDCLLWKGKSTSFYVNGKYIPVRRFAYSLRGGDQNGCFLTSCGCDKCVNPAHIVRTSRKRVNGKFKYKRITVLCNGV